MASTPLTPIVSAFDLTTAWQEIYKAEGDILRVGIDAAVFNNYSALTASYSVRLIQSGVSTILNEIITDSDIRAGANNLASAMIGQALNLDGSIEAKASANSSISIAAITATIVIS